MGMITPRECTVNGKSSLLACQKGVPTASGRQKERNEVDPPTCFKCQGRMKTIHFIDGEVYSLARTLFNSIYELKYRSGQITELVLTVCIEGSDFEGFCHTCVAFS